MKLLKSMLMNTFLSTQVLGAGESDIVIHTSQESINTLTIQDAFAFHMGTHLLENHDLASVRSFQVTNTGMEIFSFLSAQDLLNWIQAFASWVPKQSRSAFINSMNANFFGGFYPKAHITRIPRPVGSPDVYIPFEDKKMRAVFSRLSCDETDALLIPFFNDLLRCSHIPQGALFLMSAIGVPVDMMGFQTLIHFFKNLPSLEIPQSLLLSPKFMRILGKKMQSQELTFAPETGLKVASFYDFWNQFHASNHKIDFVTEYFETVPHEQDLKAFGYVCVMQDLSLELKDRFKAVENLKDLDPRYNAQVASWCIYLINDPKVDLKYQFKAIENLKNLGAAYREQVAQRCISLMESQELNLKDRFKVLDHLKDLGSQYNSRRVKEYILIIKNREVEVNDKFRALNSLKKIGEQYYRRVAQGYVSIMEDSRFDINSRIKAGNFLKKLGAVYSKHLIQGYGAIIRDAYVDTKTRLNFSNPLKLGQSYSQRLAQGYGAIMKDPCVDIQERLSVGDHLMKLGEMYHDHIIQGYESILNDPAVDQNEKSKAANYLKNLFK